MSCAAPRRRCGALIRRQCRVRPVAVRLAASVLGNFSIRIVLHWRRPPRTLETSGDAGADRASLTGRPGNGPGPTSRPGIAEARASFDMLVMLLAAARLGPGWCDHRNQHQRERGQCQKPDRNFVHASLLTAKDETRSGSTSPSYKFKVQERISFARPPQIRTRRTRACGGPVPGMYKVRWKNNRRGPGPKVARPRQAEIDWSRQTSLERAAPDCLSRGDRDVTEPTWIAPGRRPTAATIEDPMAGNRPATCVCGAAGVGPVHLRPPGNAVELSQFGNIVV
jgi:hypothetical protein